MASSSLSYDRRITSEESEQYRLRAIELSRRNESYRLDLSDILVKDEYLWKIAEQYFNEKRNDNITADVLISLPKQKKHKGCSVATQFANLEERLLDKLREDNKNIHLNKVEGILGGIYAASGELAEINMPFAKKIVNKYMHLAGNYFSDILQEANIGLIEAAHTFDYKYGVRFTTHASFYIKQRVKVALTDYRMHGVPEKPAALIRKVYEAFPMFDLNKISDSEKNALVSALGISSNDLEDILEYFRSSRTISVNHPINNGKGGQRLLANIVADTYDWEGKLLDADFFDKLTSRMDGKRKDMFIMRMQNGHKLGDIADKYNISRERVRQILEEDSLIALEDLDDIYVHKFINSIGKNNLRKIVNRAKTGRGKAAAQRLRQKFLIKNN